MVVDVERRTMTTSTEDGGDKSVRLKKSFGVATCVTIIIGLIISATIFISPTGVIKGTHSGGMALGKKQTNGFHPMIFKSFDQQFHSSTLSSFRYNRERYTLYSYNLLSIPAILVMSNMLMLWFIGVMHVGSILDSYYFVQKKQQTMYMYVFGSSIINVFSAEVHMH